MNKLYAEEYNAIANNICYHPKDNQVKVFIDYAIMNSINIISTYLALFFMVYSISIADTIISMVFSCIIFMIQPAFIFSKKIIAKKLYTKNGKILITDSFSGFVDYSRAGLIYLLKTILIFLGYLLFIVPGVILSISYQMTEYIMLDKPNMKLHKALKESRAMMRYHKKELFALGLSFFWQYILIILTFGIASIVLEPKIEMSLYLFYVHISGIDQEQDLEKYVDELNEAEAKKRERNKATIEMENERRHKREKEEWDRYNEL